MNPRFSLLLFVMAGLVVAFAPLPVPAIAPQERTFEIDARQLPILPPNFSQPGRHRDHPTRQHRCCTWTVRGWLRCFRRSRPRTNCNLDLHRRQARLLPLSMQRHLRRDAPVHDRQIDRRHKQLVISFHWVGTGWFIMGVISIKQKA
jgi:hypothetical protein